MPSFYQKGEYDLAGFAVGVVEKKKVISGAAVRPGDQLIGLASSGLHSNGYSLARKIFFDHLGLKVKSRVKGLSRPLGEELLIPTRIYVKTVLNLIRDFPVHGIAHITGGGLIENPPRVLGEGQVLRLELGAWPLPPAFGWLARAGRLDAQELLRTFNCGIGMIVVVAAKDAKKVAASFKRSGETVVTLGTIRKRKGTEEQVALSGHLAVA
jgi:phosphoribosylformylglycinamidine cyclo-ligase